MCRLIMLNTKKEIILYVFGKNAFHNMVLIFNIKKLITLISYVKGQRRLKRTSFAFYFHRYVDIILEK